MTFGTFGNRLAGGLTVNSLPVRLIMGVQSWDGSMTGATLTGYPQLFMAVYTGPHIRFNIERGHNFFGHFRVPGIVITEVALCG